MPAYVTMPGTSGNYFNTAHTNLLPSDDAHFHQSVGNWTAGAGASTLAQDTAGTPAALFGDGTAKATTDGTGAVIASLTTPTLSAVSHTVAIDIYTDTADREAFITLDGTNGTVTALTAGQWTRISATKTVTSGTKTVTVTYRQTDDSDPAASEEVWMDRACLRTGSDGTFVPSTAIVGDVDMEAKVKTSGTTDQRLIATRVANTGYEFYLASSSTQLYHRNGNGSADRGILGTPPTSPAAGGTHVYRAVHDVSANTWDLYQDGVAYTTGGAAAGATGAGSPSNQAVHVGSSIGGTAANFNGNIYYAVLRDGEDGPVVARFDADDWVGV